MRMLRRPVENTGLLGMTDLDWILLNQATSKNFNKCRSNDLLSPINRFSKN
jgi:hypothetical protein